MFIVIDGTCDTAIGPFEQYIEALSFVDAARSDFPNEGEESFEIYAVDSTQEWMTYNQVLPGVEIKEKEEVDA
jgi:hypothetical protein